MHAQVQHCFFSWAAAGRFSCTSVLYCCTLAWTAVPVIANALHVFLPVCYSTSANLCD